MALLLFVIFYITITAANYPSEFLGSMLHLLENPLIKLLGFINIPNSIVNALILGGYRILSVVISVMFPPMVIFFFLFSLLEDMGYLPRIAFNLDKCYKKCNTCGKQALTICMGFGCNAVGVTTSRIIDSPRERILAILTNNFIPCNGRFPALVCLITIFFTYSSSHADILSGALILLFIIISILTSMLITKFISSTILKGNMTSYSLELPPFRKPQIIEIIKHSVLGKSVHILSRAAIIAFPTGIIIYILCNVYIRDMSLIQYISCVMDPAGKVMGLDGTILTSFILGIPANEIILPISLMIYSSQLSLTSINSFPVIYNILSENNWTSVTAICTIIFYLMHWPCSTTILTIKKETQSLKWTLISIAIPTILGVTLCIAINFLSKMVCGI